MRAQSPRPKSFQHSAPPFTPAGFTCNLPFPNAAITYDKFHVIAHASDAVDQTRRIEQKTDPQLKGLRWALLKDPVRLSPARQDDLDALISQLTTKRTARAWS